VTAIFQRFETMWSEGVLGQVIRFGIAGGLSTLVYAAIYWPLATYVIHPVAASIAGFVGAVIFGYFVHSAWSFKGHSADTGSIKTQSKFFAVQSVGMLLNAFFTWLLTGPLVHGPTWWPLVPAVFVTPIVTFVLNRRLVFS
jgi:putative flippase GtrA